MSNNEITMEVKDTIGVINENESGWKKQLKIISWNGAEAKYDIRAWNTDETRSGKGITLNIDELRTLHKLTRDALFDVGE